MFKVGDKVRCIKAEKGQLIEVGKIYTVEKVGNRLGGLYFTIDGAVVSYFPDRFELVKEKKKAEVWTNQQIKYNLGNVFGFGINATKCIFNDKATILFYKCSFDYIPIERKIVTKCQEGDKFTKEDGLRICVLKAMKRELERELKQY